MNETKITLNIAGLIYDDSEPFDVDKIRRTLIQALQDRELNILSFKGELKNEKFNSVRYKPIDKVGNRVHTFDMAL